MEGSYLAGGQDACDVGCLLLLFVMNSVKVHDAKDALYFDSPFLSDLTHAGLGDD